MSSPGDEAFRFPSAAVDLHRVVGGRRHGVDNRMPWGLSTRERIRIEIVTPLGATLCLPFDVNIEHAAAHATTANLTEVVAHKISEVLGPDISRMGLVAFALAELHAAEEGRQPNGRFWYSPTEVADLLGYPWESNCGKGQRKSKAAIRRVDQDFAFYCKTALRQTTRIDGAKYKDTGVLIDCLERYSETISKERRGRRKRQLYQIRPELWERLRDHIRIPIPLLHCGDVDPRRWACCLRVYEELALHAWRNREALTAGKNLPLSYTWLSKAANVATKTTHHQRHADDDLRRYLKLLAARGAIIYADQSLADGQAGIHYRLDENAIQRLRQAKQRLQPPARRAK